jgi:hypothetical protein
MTATSARVRWIAWRPRIGGQATQAVYEITILEEYAKVNYLTGIITVTSGVTPRVGLSLTDTGEVTIVWSHSEECPRLLVQLYRESIKIFSNRTASLEGDLAQKEDKLKDQGGLPVGDRGLRSWPIEDTVWTGPRDWDRGSLPGRPVTNASLKDGLWYQCTAWFDHLQ